MDVPSSGLTAAPEQAKGFDSAALSGLLEVQEEGQATLLLPVARARKPASGRRSRNLAPQAQPPRSGTNNQRRRH